MKKTLLIHADNTPNNVQKSFSHENTINFKFDNGKYANIDEYISKIIIEALQSKDFDLIYIKDTLSSNYLELHGLVVAYHIRLSAELEDKKRHVPIVILSDIDGYTLNKIIPMAKILFTQNVYLEVNKLETVKRYDQKDINPLTSKEYEINFLEHVSVDAPENSSSHSIANEWAIHQWSNILGTKSDAIKNNNDKISSMLYFKYIKMMHQLGDEYQREFKKVEKEGKVLLVDDKWNEGWEDIVNEFVSYSYSDVKLDVLKYDYKNKTIKNIKSKVLDIVKPDYPDVLLLDLRLTEDDNSSDDDKKSISKISGFKIIKEVQDINPGIQIIMFTASGDSLILDELHRKGILGYIKKDAPTDKYEASKNSLKKLDTLIKKGLEKKYLKEVWIMRTKILDLDILRKDEENFIKIKAEIETIFEILNSNLENKIKFTILTIFKVLEILSDKFELKGSEFNKIIKLFQINNLTTYDKEISQLVCTRNFLVHSGNKDKLSSNCMKNNTLIEEPEVENILTWFKMLQTILVEINVEIKERLKQNLH